MSDKEAWSGIVKLIQQFASLLFKWKVEEKK